MRDQFQLLLTLQEVDDHLRALAAEEQQLPQRLQAYESACAAARQQLTAQQTAIEQNERQQRACERDLASHQEALRRTQNKTHAIKTNAEYSALLAEIETGKQRLEVLEDEILGLMEAADQQRQLYRQQEQHVQTALRELDAQQQHLQQVRDDLHRAMTGEQARRQHTIAQLDAKLYAQYQKVAVQHGGRSVAQLREGVCSGCYLKVPPQLISEIRLQTQLFTCPHCRLMLFWPT
jgi:predicted  nucleic acid-binding Zn-ribbon protein